MANELNSVQAEETDGRFLGFQYGRVTNNEDPETQGRVKVNLHWQQEDDDEEQDQDFETGWITRILPYVGPTNMQRGRRFAVDWPLPEVNSLVLVGFINANPHDGFYLGQPSYLEDPYGAPDLVKDKRRDWSFRMDLQNGFSFIISTEGDAVIDVPGRLMIKALRSLDLGSSGELNVVAPFATLVGLSVLSLLGVTNDEINYPRPEAWSAIREIAINVLKREPGYKDPEIGEIPDLE